MRFNSPEFLRCAIKTGLMKPTADLMEAYQCYGSLLRNETLRVKRAGGLNMVQAIEALQPQELRSIRDNMAGVLLFGSAA